MAITLSFWAIFLQHDLHEQMFLSIAAFWDIPPVYALLDWSDRKGITGEFADPISDLKDAAEHADLAFVEVIPRMAKGKLVWGEGVERLANEHRIEDAKGPIPLEGLNFG